MPRLFILAGEASGDRIAASLIGGLHASTHIDVIGVGGEAMAGQGLQSLFPMEDLAVMGYADVLARLPLLLWRASQVVRTILREQPDTVVLVDAQVFSQVVASRLRKRGFSKPILLYVAPAVWAWKPERAVRISPLYDEVLAVLPFEPKVMRELGGPQTTYVRHAALERFPARPVQPTKGPVLLLPGSRAGELRRHLPLMRDVAVRLAGHSAVTGFVLPTPKSQYGRIKEAVASWSVPVSVISDDAERAAALSSAVLGLAVSGTVTLELALAGVPHVVTYIGEAAQVRLYKKALTRQIALPNIIAAQEVVPELLFAGRGDAEKVVHTLSGLLDDDAARARQVEGFIAIRSLMENGYPEAPVQSATERVLSYLSRD